MSRKLQILTFNIVFLFGQQNVLSMPKGFVYLREIDSSIQQEIRYASSNNFVGRVIKGYINQECILTLPAAQRLHQLQNSLKKYGLSLKVYDCYRPVRAVQDFYEWSQNPWQQHMKAYFYPNISKIRLFPEGYIAKNSTHCSGSTVDLTLVKIIKKPKLIVLKNKILRKNLPSFDSYELHMGTSYDFMDIRSHTFTLGLDHTALHNRILLRSLMRNYGFAPYNKEWWHFTLRNEPFKNHSFNFLVQ